MPTWQADFGIKKHTQHPQMFVYFLISVLVSYNGDEAAPTLVDRPDVESLQSKQTLFAVILSCISTIIICTWNSVHPNVPPPNKWNARWNRLALMFWMIVATELVLAWAVKQLFSALRQIRDEYNQSRRGRSDNIFMMLVQTMT